MNLNVSNEFLATQFPKLLKLRTLDLPYACKEEATSANAHTRSKKGHLSKNFLGSPVNDALYGRKPYTQAEHGHSTETENCDFPGD